VDGVCCDSACTGTCRSCLKNRTGLATDGVCGNTVDDTDPENECAVDVGYPASCKAPGLCNGQGACRVYAKAGIVAKATVCNNVTLTTTSCDGAGNLDPHDIPCYPYKCNVAGNACRVACTAGTQAQDCDDSSFCGEGGICVGQKLNGSECRDNTECKSRHCANIGKEPKAEDTGAGGDSAGGAAGGLGIHRGHGQGARRDPAGDTRGDPLAICWARAAHRRAVVPASEDRLCRREIAGRLAAPGARLDR
jgi:hypothetical protein